MTTSEDIAGDGAGRGGGARPAFFEGAGRTAAERPAGAAQSASRRFLRKLIHSFSNRFLYDRRRTRVVKAAGFRLTVGPTVFHPAYFLTGPFFAEYLGTLDLRGKRVVEVGTGSGVIALAAARAGAARVVALDINPEAVRSAAANAAANGLAERFEAVQSDLFSALPAEDRFDVVLSSPPSFPGEPLDVADRAWHAGPEYRDIVALFEQARARLAPGGTFYLLLSSDSDLALLGGFAERAGFRARLVARKSIVFEQFVLYALTVAD